MVFPKWATPQRRASLVELFNASRGFCVYHHDPCPDLAHDCFQAMMDRLIDGWKEDDRDERSQLRELENRQWHALPKILKRGPFDSIRREIFLGQRPLFEVVGVGVSGLSYKRTAQIVVPGLFRTVLWVDLSNIKPEGSKNRRRKLARYKKGVAPQSVEAQINDSCRRVAIAYMEKASRA